MTREERKDFQQTLNAFTHEWLEGVEPVRVDGDFGHATNTRVRTVEYYLGYDQDRIKELGDSYRTDDDVRRELVRRMRHPMDPQHVPNPSRDVREAVVARGRKRRRAQKRRERRNNFLAWLVPGVTKWEGRTVAKCAVPYLNYARENDWRGGVTSGWRDPWYSRALCIAMCGMATCLGRCAGLTSNHVGNICSRFAIDVSDYVKFGQLMREMPERLLPHGRRIFNTLGSRDPVHYSPSGN